MLAASGLTVHVGGNIGTPLIDRLDSILPGDRIVLELSSFQLELFDAAVAWGELTAVGPAVSAILNVTPNHLDRHPQHGGLRCRQVQPAAPPARRRLRSCSTRTTG